MVDAQSARPATGPRAASEDGDGEEPASDTWDSSAHDGDGDGDSEANVQEEAVTFTGKRRIVKLRDIEKNRMSSLCKEMSRISMKDAQEAYGSFNDRAWIFKHPWRLNLTREEAFARPCAIWWPSKFYGIMEEHAPCPRCRDPLGGAHYNSGKWLSPKKAREVIARNRTYLLLGREFTCRSSSCKATYRNTTDDYLRGCPELVRKVFGIVTRQRTALDRDLVRDMHNMWLNAPAQRVVDSILESHIRFFEDLEHNYMLSYMGGGAPASENVKKRNHSTVPEHFESQHSQNSKIGIEEPTHKVLQLEKIAEDLHHWKIKDFKASHFSDVARGKLLAENFIHVRELRALKRDFAKIAHISEVKAKLQNRIQERVRAGQLREATSSLRRYLTNILDRFHDAWDAKSKKACNEVLSPERVVEILQAKAKREASNKKLREALSRKRAANGLVDIRRKLTRREAPEPFGPFDDPNGYNGYLLGRGLLEAIMYEEQCASARPAVREIVSVSARCVRIDCTFNYVKRVRVTLKDGKITTTFQPFGALLTIMNEHNQVAYIRSLRDGENMDELMEALDDFRRARVFMEGKDYRPIAIWTDNCCKQRGVIQRLWPGVNIFLDAFHWLKRWDNVMLPRPNHPLRKLFSRTMADAVLAPDLDRAERFKNEKGEIRHRSNQAKRSVPRAIPRKNELLKRVSRVLECFIRLDAQTTLSNDLENLASSTGIPLRSEGDGDDYPENAFPRVDLPNPDEFRMAATAHGRKQRQRLFRRTTTTGKDWMEYIKTMFGHIQLGCLADPEDVDVHVQLNNGDISTIRGTGANERFHRALNERIGVSPVGILRAEAYLLACARDHNRRRAAHLFPVHGHSVIDRFFSRTHRLRINSLFNTEFRTGELPHPNSALPAILLPNLAMGFAILPPWIDPEGRRNFLRGEAVLTAPQILDADYDESVNLGLCSQLHSVILGYGLCKHENRDFDLKILLEKMLDRTGCPIMQASHVKGSIGARVSAYFVRQNGENSLRKLLGLIGQIQRRDVKLHVLKIDALGAEFQHQVEEVTYNGGWKRSDKFELHIANMPRSSAPRPLDLARGLPSAPRVAHLVSEAEYALPADPVPAFFSWLPKVTLAPLRSQRDTSEATLEDNKTSNQWVGIADALGVQLLQDRTPEDEQDAWADLDLDSAPQIRKIPRGADTTFSAPFQHSNGSPLDKLERGLFWHLVKKAKNWQSRLQGRNDAELKSLCEEILAQWNCLARGGVESEIALINIDTGWEGHCSQLRFKTVKDFTNFALFVQRQKQVRFQDREAVNAFRQKQHINGGTRNLPANQLDESIELQASVNSLKSLIKARDAAGVIEETMGKDPSLRALDKAEAVGACTSPERMLRAPLNTQHSGVAHRVETAMLAEPGSFFGHQSWRSQDNLDPSRYCIVCRERKTDNAHRNGNVCSKPRRVWSMEELRVLHRSHFKNAPAPRVLTPLCKISSKDGILMNSYKSLLEKAFERNSRAQFTFVHRSHRCGRRHSKDGIRLQAGIKELQQLSTANGWLTSFVMKVFVEILRENNGTRKDGCAFVCTHSGRLDRSLHREASVAIQASQSRKSWEKLKKYETCVPSNLRFVFMPVCYNSHWTLMYLDVMKGRLVLYDPIAGFSSLNSFATELRSFADVMGLKDCFSSLPSPSEACKEQEHARTVDVIDLNQEDREVENVAETEAGHRARKGIKSKRRVRRGEKTEPLLSPTSELFKTENWGEPCYRSGSQRNGSDCGIYVMMMMAGLAAGHSETELDMALTPEAGSNAIPQKRLAAQIGLAELFLDNISFNMPFQTQIDQLQEQMSQQ